MIWILNENLKILKILHKYTMAQFIDKARDVGTFIINAVFCEENLYLLDKNVTYYVLYNQKNCDYDLLGKIEKVEKEDDEDSNYPNTIKIEGSLILFLFKKRVLNGTFNANEAKISDFVETLINGCYVNVDDSDRKISINITKNVDASTFNIDNITKEVTGGTLYDSIQPLLEQNNLCIKIKPIIENVHDLSEIYTSMTGETNISAFDIIICTGNDRRKGNTQGYVPVIISKSLSNVKRTSYRYNRETDANFAYVAGEGEGTERKWYGIQKDNTTRKSAWNRDELWVDARDIQSQQNDDTVLTDEEYEKLINQRAKEKFEENALSEEYESTLNTLDKRYVYGIDFELGDWVTVVDNDLKIQMDAQIIQVTTTVKDNGEIIDLEFQYGKVTKKVSENFLQSDAKMEKLQNEINYLSSIKNERGGASELSVKRYSTIVSPLLSNASTFMLSMFNENVNQVLSIFSINQNYIPIITNANAGSNSVTGIMCKWENGSLIKDTSNYNVNVVVLYV